MQAVEEKVEYLEGVLGRFIIHTDMFLSRLERDIKILDDEVKATSDNVSNLSNKVKATSDNVSNLSNEVKATSDNVNNLSKATNDSVKALREELREETRKLNKQWGALANKMGTIDEDLVAPAVRPVMEQYFKCEPITRAIRVSRRMGSESFEVDVLAVCERQVFMIEVKSAPKIEHVEQIIEKTGKFKQFFPEYEDKLVVPIFASIVFPDEVVSYATKKSLYVMAYREWEYMDIINFDELERK